MAGAGERQAPRDAAEDAGPSSLKAFVTKARDVVLAPFVEIGMLARLLFEAFYWGVRPPYRLRLIIDSMEFIGVGSLFIITLTAFFIGAVLGLQLVDGFRSFNAENQAGAVIGVALAREMGPVFTALMVSSRAGSAITAQLGSMRVSHQIDALVTMAVNPVQYLVVPRLIAGVVMVPVLDILFNIVGMFGAWAVSVHMLGLDSGIFLDRMRTMVEWDDVMQGVMKSAIFGATVCLIACRQGFYTTGGAAGVGQATNRAVVHNAIAILALDYIVTSLLLGEGLF